jgi:Carboxypeptidase regulatory-like domain
MGRIGGILTCCLLGWLATTTPATAQDSTATLVGFLRDSLDGTPIGEARIWIEGSDLSTLSREDGSFSLQDVALGLHTLTLAKAGFRPKSFQFEITADFLREVDIGGIGLTPIPSYTVKVEGTLTDVNSGRPIEGATVTLNGLYKAQSRDDGRYEVQGARVPEGNSVVQVRRIGYESASYPFRVARDSQVVRVDLPLLPMAVQLEEILVEGRVVTVPPKLRDFFDRRDHAEGEFLTPWEIEANPTPRVSDLLRTLKYVRVIPTERGGNHVELGRGCWDPPRIYIDGLEVPSVEIDDVISYQELAAVEVYSGAARIPHVFENPNRQGCGVIVLWTK